MTIDWNLGSAEVEIQCFITALGEIFRRESSTLGCGAIHPN